MLQKRTRSPFFFFFFPNTVYRSEIQNGILTDTVVGKTFSGAKETTHSIQIWMFQLKLEVTLFNPERYCCVCATIWAESSCFYGRASAVCCLSGPTAENASWIWLATSSHIPDCWQEGQPRNEQPGSRLLFCWVRHCIWQRILIWPLVYAMYPSEWTPSVVAYSGHVCRD